MFKAIAALLLGFAMHAPGFAQPLPCRSFTGVPVPYIANPGLGDVGVAHMLANGQPVIQMNPIVLSGLPEFVRQFWYAHECAHHALHPAMNSEPNADCYAIKAIRNVGLVSGPNDVKALLSHISMLPGSVMTGHLPGQARAGNLFFCLNTP